MASKNIREYRKNCKEIWGLDKCILCPETISIEVHHFDGCSTNNHPVNLIPLCSNCHGKAGLANKVNPKTTRPWDELIEDTIIRVRNDEIEKRLGEQTNRFGIIDEGWKRRPRLPYSGNLMMGHDETGKEIIVSHPNITKRNSASLRRSFLLKRKKLRDVA